MRKQLSYIAPLKLGIILAVLYGVLAVIFVPFLLIFAMFGPRHAGGMPAVVALVMTVILPVIYAVVGFIFGVIAAAIYNLIAKWTGGIEFETRDVPAYSQPGAPTGY